MGGFFAAESAAVVDAEASSAVVTVSFVDHLGFPHSDTRTSRLSGEIKVYGRQDSDGSANLIVDFGLEGTNMTYEFEGVDIFGNPEVPITNLSIHGGTDTTTVHIRPDGMGMIPTGVLMLGFELSVKGKKVIAHAANDRPVAIKVDFAGGVFAIPMFEAAVTSTMRGRVALRGTFINRPPRVDAGPDQIVECTSVASTPVQLKGIVTDPDGPANVRQISWFRGFEYTGGSFSSDLAPTVSLPLSPGGAPDVFTLLARDGSFQADLARTRVTVRDTTPPVLDVSVSPDCLWAPNHEMVLFELGRELSAVATDACDPAPAIGIASVTSSQPVVGGGSGQTRPDVIFGKRAFCLRSERQGTSEEPRAYAISVKATDASGNETSKVVTVKVGHDQGAFRCPKVDGARIVEEGDPRCSAN
ncbi:MAG: hypothetical protein KF819_25065 [Labilithrix sp.]|nr:hypothetical protein [Labilithrix sp.]